MRRASTAIGSVGSRGLATAGGGSSSSAFPDYVKIVEVGPRDGLQNEPAIVHRKVAILGFRAVGKTSLTQAFVSGTFADT